MTAPTGAGKKRRTYGTGGLTQRADGLWVATIEAGWSPTGTRRRIRVAAKTKAECQRKLRDKQRQIAKDGLPAHGADARTTVKSWGETWIEHNTQRLRPNTVADRASVLRKWIVPMIGHKRLDSLSTADVRAVTAAIIKAGLSSSTANNAHRVLQKMLKDAKASELQVPEAVFSVPAPNTAANTRSAIPTRDVRALLKTSEGTPDHTRWAAALIQGLRQGEALGLTWECVDLDAAVIDVSWQLQELPYIAGRRGALKVPLGYDYRRLEGRYALTPLKTKRGKRVIPLVGYMLDALTAWQRVAPPNEYGLVWPGPGGRPRDRHADLDAWLALQDTAAVHKGEKTGPDGRPVPVHYVLHEARNSASTLLLDIGADPETVKAILGHTNIEMSRRYQTVSQELTRRALEGVAAELQLG